MHLVCLACLGLYPFTVGLGCVLFGPGLFCAWFWTVLRFQLLNFGLFAFGFISFWGLLTLG